MKDKYKSERVILKTESVNDEVYRVTKNGDVATVWRCRANGVWRELKQMPLEEFEAWAVRENLLGLSDGGYALLSTLAGKVEEEVNNS
jgi:hypothetical protein